MINRLNTGGSMKGFDFTLTEFFSEKRLKEIQNAATFLNESFSPLVSVTAEGEKLVLRIKSSKVYEHEVLYSQRKKNVIYVEKTTDYTILNINTRLICDDTVITLFVNFEKNEPIKTLIIIESDSPSSFKIF